MTKPGRHRNHHASDGLRKSRLRWPRAAAVVVVAVAGLTYVLTHQSPDIVVPPPVPRSVPSSDITGWPARALAISRLFHEVYTPCWEGAYGAIGDAYLFAATGDSSLFRFHLQEHDLRGMCEGTWVDDAAWVCLAELKWWEMTGKRRMDLVKDAARRYQRARSEGRLSDIEGFWTWYNWPPAARVNERVFTNSNMDQMATVASGLFLVTGDRRYLKDALLVWEGDGRTPGISQKWYRGQGRWEGRPGAAAFGKELPWDGAGCASIAAALYRATGRMVFKDVAVATVRRILDPATGWVSPDDFYQLKMDGNGAFVNFLLDAYAIAPRELAEVPQKVERMLEHVWTNHHGLATVILHRIADHGIRNGWNPSGGEDGYGVDEVGTVHAQGEAARAFGAFVYYDLHPPGKAQ